MAEGADWLERIRKRVSYYEEALDFIGRVGKQLDVTPADAPALCMLWVEADALDETICSLVSEINDGLLEGRGELDITRGASVRPTGPTPGPDQESVFYECSWTLTWDDALGVSVNLAIDPRVMMPEGEVRAAKAGLTRRTRYPLEESDLKGALADAYVAEVTLASPW